MLFAHAPGPAIARTTPRLLQIALRRFRRNASLALASRLTEPRSWRLSHLVEAPVADDPRINMMQTMHGGWVVEPADIPNAASEIRAFAERGAAAVYAAQLGAKHRVTTIIFPPLGMLDS